MYEGDPLTLNNDHFGIRLKNSDAQGTGGLLGVAGCNATIDDDAIIIDIQITNWGNPDCPEYPSDFSFKERDGVSPIDTAVHSFDAVTGIVQLRLDQDNYCGASSGFTDPATGLVIQTSGNIDLDPVSGSSVAYEVMDLQIIGAQLENPPHTSLQVGWNNTARLIIIDNGQE